jgi:hypothetical protein
VGCQALLGLEPASKVVSCDEVREMLSKLLIIRQETCNEYRS